MKKALLLTIISLAPLAQAETQNEIPLLPTNAPANSPAIPVSDAQSCVAISDPATRLACYDRAYTAPNQAEPKSIDIAQSHAASKAAQSPQIVFAEPSAGEIYSPLSQQYDLDKNNENGVFSIREHEPMYIMPAWYRSSPNYTPSTPTRGVAIDAVHTQQKRIETKMQISLKTKIAEDLFGTHADLWAGYTQQSNWQVYNRGKKSAPFRNSDYAPELFITQPVKANLPFGGKLRMLGVGYIHQSNGQSQPLSRSWNRIYAMAGMEWGKLSVIPRIWARLDPGADKDDNPDIMRYMGYGDLRLAYQFDNKHALSGTLRYNPKHNKGAVQLNYTFPLKGNLKGYVQGFYGYGESLIDYNHKQKGIGVGLMFNGWDAL
ncbi:phospholipase A [Kingella oralis]|nr:phospholipase A [Kingella oralis]QMT43223.1 phospholipase A [Kingella oralis]